MYSLFVSIARENMINGQFLPNKLTNEAVIKAFRSVDREVLLPSVLHGTAYSDEMLKLTYGHYIRYELSSMGFMRLLQAANIDNHERVLIMGDPTGYATFLVSYLAQQVTTLEQNPIWYTQMSEKVYKISPHNVTLFNGPYHIGVPSQAPFDCILVCGCTNIDLSKVMTQLKPRGRLFAFEPVIPNDYYQTSRLYRVNKIERTRTKTFLLEALAPNIGLFSGPDETESFTL